MTPVVLQVAKDVIGFLGEQLRERAREQGEGAIDRVIARLVNRNGGEGTQSRWRSSRTSSSSRCATLAIKKGRALKLSDERATLLADSLVGSLATGMSAGAAAPERRPRLNPFAFPSDTAFRFGLLVTAVLGANLYVWQWIATVSRSADEHIDGRPRLLGGLAAARPLTCSIHRRDRRVLGLRLAALPLPGRGGCSAAPLPS